MPAGRFERSKKASPNNQGNRCDISGDNTASLLATTNRHRWRFPYTFTFSPTPLTSSRKLLVAISGKSYRLLLAISVSILLCLGALIVRDGICERWHSGTYKFKVLLSTQESELVLITLKLHEAGTETNALLSLVSLFKLFPSSEYTAWCSVIV